MARQYDVMVAGHLCFDVIPRFPDTGATRIDEILRPGKLVQMEEAMMSTGGPVSNTGIGLKKLGSNVCFCARVGDDDFGKLTIDYLKTSGNADGIHVVSNSASSYTVALAPPNIDRIFLHNPGTNNEFCADDLTPELISQCKHFHFGYPPLMRRMYENDGKELQRVFEMAKLAGATTSCDMALPDPSSESGKASWRTILENILPFVDIFLPSVEEAFFMLEPEDFLKMKEEKGGAELIDYLTAADYSRLADKLLALGAKMTSLKSGHRGFYFKTKDHAGLEGLGEAEPGDIGNWASRELWCPAFNAAQLASATGSGDSSIAGFLSAFFRGLTLEESLRVANCVGWQNVQELDALSGIKSWDQTIDMLQTPMRTNELNITMAGWVESKEFGLWAGPNDPIAHS